MENRQTTNSSLGLNPKKKKLEKSLQFAVFFKKWLCQMDGSAFIKTTQKLSIWFDVKLSQGDLPHHQLVTSPPPWSSKQTERQ